jgi:hypothetical protein
LIFAALSFEPEPPIINMKSQRAYRIAMKRFLSQKGKPYATARPPRPRPPRRPFRWRPRPMAVDIPPLDDLMDIDQAYELEVVGCPPGQGYDGFLLEEMDICPPLPEEMDICPPFPVPTSCPLGAASFSPPGLTSTPVAGSALPCSSHSIPFARPPLVRCSRGRVDYPDLSADPSVAPSAAPSATLAAQSAPFLSVATAATMVTAGQYHRLASPLSQDSTPPPRASRDGTMSPLEHERGLSPVNGPVMVLADDVEDVSSRLYCARKVEEKINLR